MNIKIGCFTKKNTELICPKCKQIEITWKDVYSKENERLVKLEKLQIGWCFNCNNYILK